jgi:hypothetical protein
MAEKLDKVRMFDYKGTDCETLFSKVKLITLWGENGSE